MPARRASPPASRTSAARAGAVASRTWPTGEAAGRAGSRGGGPAGAAPGGLVGAAPGGLAGAAPGGLCGRRAHQLVARRDDCHARARVHGDFHQAGGRQHAEVLGAQWAAGWDELRVWGVLVGADHSLAGRRGAQDLEQLGVAAGACSTFTTASAPWGQRRSGRDRDRRAPSHLDIRWLAHADLARDVEELQSLRRAVGVRCAHREAIDGRTREARQRVRRAERLGRDAAKRVVEATASTGVRRAGRKPASASETLRTVKNSREPAPRGMSGVDGAVRRVRRAVRLALVWSAGAPDAAAGAPLCPASIRAR